MTCEKRSNMAAEYLLLMYAYQELKKQLEFIEEIRFIFIAPTFVKEKPRNKKASSTSHGYRVKRDSTVPNSRSGFVTK